jgi:hypothetical protein
MLATLTDAPFDDPEWIFEDKYDGFRMVSEIHRGKVALYSRNGKIISHSYVEVARALEGVKTDAVIDGELVAIGKDGVSHFQLLQNALRHEAKLLYCVRPHVRERRGSAGAAVARAKETAHGRPAAPQADRVQRAPQGQREEVLRRSRTESSRRHHGQVHIWR